MPDVYHLGHLVICNCLSCRVAMWLKERVKCVVSKGTTVIFPHVDPLLCFVDVIANPAGIAITGIRTS